MPLRGKLLSLSIRCLHRPLQSVQTRTRRAAFGTPRRRPRRPTRAGRARAADSARRPCLRSKKTGRKAPHAKPRSANAVTSSNESIRRKLGSACSFSLSPIHHGTHLEGSTWRAPECIRSNRERHRLQTVRRRAPRPLALMHCLFHFRWRLPLLLQLLRRGRWHWPPLLPDSSCPSETWRPASGSSRRAAIPRRVHTSARPPPRRPQRPSRLRGKRPRNKKPEDSVTTRGSNESLSESTS